MGGAITLASSDLDAVLDATEELGLAMPTEEAVRGLLCHVSQLVPCDLLFWNRLQLRQPVHRIAEIGFPDGPQEAPWDDWVVHLEQHPIMSGKHGEVTALSDVLTGRDLRESWLYREALLPGGVEHEIGVHLSRPAGQIHVVVLSRGPGRDYDDRDRLVLRMLRPHLDAAFRRLAFPIPRLTRRETDVMRLVGDGLTNAQIARRLRVSEPTVGKHLENVYARTGAQSRVQALSLCAPALDPG